MLGCHLFRFRSTGRCPKALRRQKTSSWITANLAVKEKVLQKGDNIRKDHDSIHLFKYCGIKYHDSIHAMCQNRYCGIRHVLSKSTRWSRPLPPNPPNPSWGGDCFWFRSMGVSKAARHLESNKRVHESLLTSHPPPIKAKLFPEGDTTIERLLWQKTATIEKVYRDLNKVRIEDNGDPQVHALATTIADIMLIAKHK